MSTALYLADTSAVIRLVRCPDQLERWDPHLAAGQVAICPIVELEVLRACGAKPGYGHWHERLRCVFGWLPEPDDVTHRAISYQASLAALGQHQGPGTIDLMIAATAEFHGVPVLHYDHDFATIARNTSCGQTWLAPPGSLP